MEKKFNERVQDLILYAGGKEEASEILGVSVGTLNEMLEMEEAPNDAVEQAVENEIERIEKERVEKALEEGKELDEPREASGMLDRAITFFNGMQIENQVGELQDQIDPEKTYEIGLDILKEGDIHEYTFFIDGEDLIDLRHWESIAWEQFRIIADEFGSDIAINVSSIA